jgi:biopolymer transport protein ExbB
MYAIFVRGGLVMWPLLACSIMSVAITIERALFWLRHYRSSDGRLMEDMLARTERGDFEGAAAAGAGAVDMVARVLHSGITQRAHGLTESMQVAAEQEVARMKWGLGVLDTIVTLAPLLGLLGTVIGMIQSFGVLGQAGVEDPRAATGGIAGALIATAAGLSIAIPTLVSHNYFAHAVQRGTMEIENAGTRLEVAYRKGLEKRDASA